MNSEKYILFKHTYPLTFVRLCSMNSKAVRNRPIVDRPWSVEEWKVEVCATTRKASDMVRDMLEADSLYVNE